MLSLPTYSFYFFDIAGSHEILNSRNFGIIRVDKFIRKTTFVEHVLGKSHQLQGLLVYTVQNVLRDRPHKESIIQLNPMKIFSISLSKF